MNIAIYGTGGLGRETACLINTINKTKSDFKWNFIGFFDDNEAMWGCDIFHYGKCLGGINELNGWKEPIAIVIAVGSPNALKSIYNKINNHNVSFPNIIHPDFVINDPMTFKIGHGNIIQSGCSVSCNVTFGNFNIFNGSVVFGHDDIVGDYNTFMPATRISGEVCINDCNFFGVNSIILQQINIGNNIRLAAGSVLMRKPKDGCLYLGNPAKKTEF